MHHLSQGFQFHDQPGNGSSGGFASGLSTRRFGQVTMRNPQSQNFRRPLKPESQLQPSPAQPTKGLKYAVLKAWDPPLEMT